MFDVFKEKALGDGLVQGADQDELFSFVMREIPYDKGLLRENGKARRVVDGHDKIIRVNDRRIAVIEINKLKLPFYISSGENPKDGVTPGQWYPFFGIGSDEWLNKGRSVDMAEYYGSEVLKKISHQLDEVYGDLRRDISIPKVTDGNSHLAYINQDMQALRQGEDYKLAARIRSEVIRVVQSSVDDLQDFCVRPLSDLRVFIK